MRLVNRTSSERHRGSVEGLILPSRPSLIALWLILSIVHALSAAAQTSGTTSRQISPELVLQTGHNMKIDQVVFSPDGRWLASASADQTIKMWDAATGRELRTLTGHSGWVKCVAFSPDGRLLASGSNDKTVKIWDVASGQEVRTLAGHSGPVESLGFSFDGRWLASGSADQTVRLWDVATGNELRTLTGHGGWVMAVAFSPNGRLLASGSADQTIKLWDMTTGREKRTLSGHSDRVRAIAFSPDSQWLASGSFDKSIKLWKVGSDQARFTLKGHAGNVNAVAFSQDGQWLVTGSTDRIVKIWNAATGQQTRTLKDSVDAEPAESISFSSDLRWFALGSGSRTIEIRDLATGNQRQSLESHSSGLYAVAFSPDGRWLASGNNDRAVRLWDLATGRELPPLTGHTGWVTTVAFNKESRLIASGSLSGTIKIWDVVIGREVYSLAGHSSSVNTVAFSPDGKWLASGSVDQTIKLWDVATGREVRSLNGHASEITSVSFSPDGRLLASGSVDKTVELWDVATGREARSLAGHTGVVNAVAFSQDGKWLASGSADKTVKLWDVATGREARTLAEHSSGVNALAFSLDGRWLASGSNDKTVRLWDVTTGRAGRTLSGHSGSINAVAFSPDGRWLASGSEDGSMLLWDTQTGGLLSTLTSLRESNDWLVVTPDGLFDGSPAAWNQILWRFSQNTFNVAPVEVFFNEFYYPGLLADILAGKKPRAAQDIAQKDRRQPQLRLALLDDQDPAREIGKRHVRVKIEVTEAIPDKDHPTGSGARDVRLFRNGSLVKVWHGDVSLDREGKGGVELSLPIIAGENHLTAYAFNRDNIKTSDVALTLIGASSLKRPGTAFVLVVGVNKYTNPQYNLKYAVQDAQDFGEELRRAQARLGNFADIEVIPLLDQDGTKDNIMLALKRLSGSELATLPPGTPEVLKTVKPSQPEDAVIIYFAGHGTARESKFYLIPHDLGYEGERTKLDEASLKTILAHSISDRELEAAIEEMDVGQLLLVIDACNSGQALEAEEKRRGPMNSKGLAQLAYEKGMYILTAAQSYQAAVETSELGHGYLTYALVEEGLKSGVADTSPKDGQVVAQEWLDYATERVPQMQAEKLQPSRQKQQGRLLVQETAPAEDRTGNVKERSIQRPRVFYRREIRPLVVARPGAS